jgi:DNA-binding transcriptional MerR regulator
MSTENIESPPLSALLQGYVTPPQLAQQLGITLRTLRRWEQKRLAPPRTVIARQIFYRVSSVKSWMESREQRRRS